MKNNAIETIGMKYSTGALNRVAAIREVYYAMSPRTRTLKRAIDVVDQLPRLSAAETLLKRGLDCGVFDDAPSFKLAVRKLLKEVSQ